MSEEHTEPSPSPKIDTRLSKVMRLALDAYMRDRHLTNESELLRSLLGQFLEREGYLTRDEKDPATLVVRETPEPPPLKKKDNGGSKRIGFDLKSQPTAHLWIPPNEWDSKESKPKRIDGSKK